jgi:hypothetical protein
MGVAPVRGVQCMTLAGNTSSYISWPTRIFDVLYTLQTFTVGIWMRSTTATPVGNDQVLFGFEGGYGSCCLYHDGTDTSVSWSTSGAFANRLTSSIRTYDQTWHYVVAIFDRGTTRVLIDGMAAGTKTQTLANFTGSTFGSRVGGTANLGSSMPVSIAECSIWAKVLADSEIQILKRRPGILCDMSQDFAVSGLSGNRRRRLLVGAGS